jgi:2-dehydro-3-deoxyglucarate aldolase/4-hydroxy-2-oxoheptanedioate aldolase
MGMLGQFDNPRFIAAIDAVGAAAKANGKAAGILLPKPDDCAWYLEKGYTFLASGSDGVLLNNAARNVLRTLRTASGQS